MYIADVRFDWALLRKQKEWLLEQAGANYSEVPAGLINLIDHLQDLAVEQGVSEEEVFGTDWRNA